MTHHIPTAALWAGLVAYVAALLCCGAFIVGAVAYMVAPIFRAGWGAAQWVMG